MDTTTTNTTPVPAWRAKIAGIRQRVDEADAKKRQAELNDALVVIRQKQVDLTFVLQKLGIVSGMYENECNGDSTVFAVDGLSFYLAFPEEDGLFYPYLSVMRVGKSSSVPLFDCPQTSNWRLSREYLRPIDDIAYDLDVAIEALESEAAR